MEDLLNWIEKNNIQIDTLEENLIIINNESYLFIKPKDDLIIKPPFQLNLTEEEFLFECDYYLFEFGGEFYYTPKQNWKKIQLNIFKYIGKKKRILTLPFSNLGVHGPYEILTGSTHYELWAKKAKWLNHSALGIVERHTLSGVLKFQSSCIDNDLKPIIGEEILIKDEEVEFSLKLYVKNKEGWNNLVIINNIINLEFDKKFIPFDLFKSLNLRGLICVINNSIPFEQKYLQLKGKFLEDFYYQLDSISYLEKNHYLDFLNKTKYYFRNMSKMIPPLLISDSYYLEEEDIFLKKTLDKILKNDKLFGHSSDNQFYKDIDDHFNIFEQYLNNSNKNDFLDLFLTSIKNLEKLVEEVDFKLKSDSFHLPKFFEDLEKSKSYLSNLTFQKLKEKQLDEDEEYLDRYNRELEFINNSGFTDYFLILWDLIEWCKKENILTGLGRGSAAGSLISYLLDITRIDPIKYNLLFERFLNEGRAGKRIVEIFLEGKILKLNPLDKVKIRRKEEVLIVTAEKLLKEDDFLEVV